MIDDMALVRHYTARSTERHGGLLLGLPRKIEDSRAMSHCVPDELRRHGRANLRTDG